MGSNFIHYLHSKYPEYSIVNLDLLTYAGNPANLESIATSDRYHFIHGDICDTKLLDTIFNSYTIETIVNFAGESHVDRSIINSHAFIHTNVNGVFVLLEAVRRYQVPRFIQISTDEIYGDTPEGFSTEKSQIFPSSPYSASKASADVIVQAFMRTHKVPAIILRSSNNFGPYQYPEKLVPVIILSFLEHTQIPLHGNGTHVRSWVYVSDFCRALDLVLHKSELYKIYNVSGTLKTNVEVIEEIARMLGKKADEHIKYVADRQGADLRYAPSCEKIKSELQWAPEHDFASALHDTVEWYQGHRAWWEKIKATKNFKVHHQKQFKTDR